MARHALRPTGSLPIANRWQALPLEVGEMIVAALDVWSAEALERCSRALHLLVTGNERLWQRAYANAYPHDLVHEDDRAWVDVCRAQLAALEARPVWLRIYGRRARLDRWWRDGHDARLAVRMSRSLPLRRPADVKMHTRPDWALISNGRKTCLIGRASAAGPRKLWWLESRSAPHAIKGHDSSTAVAATASIAAGARIDDVDMESTMKVRTVELSDRYAAVRVSSLHGNHGLLRVWRTSDRQCILSQAVRGFSHELELRNRWLCYFEDKGEKENGRDRIVVVDLESTPWPRSYRLTSPDFAAEGHLQRASDTSAEFFHAYYSGQKYRWRIYQLTVGSSGKMVRDDLFPPTRIYPGHATAQRVEANDDQVLVYGRGDHRFGCTAWMSVMQLSSNRLLWERDVGYTPADGIGAVQIGGGRLIWPFGHQSVKVLDLRDGALQHYVDFGGQRLSSLLLLPVIGSLLLVGVIAGESDAAATDVKKTSNDWCLMMDADTGELIRGPRMAHTHVSRRSAFAVSALGLTKWDGKQLEDTMLRGT
ncbi:hypothetical protein THASP1DRAFT_23689 [Thamnocephalis sphaerospora]|uniref:F-box domain-containing protein n=1 Tax=Thamnocephalis sphaerospora TaxID=78915 RepID=A0A4P9XQF6_9FUNG|nr:hypothetical protein THASP1DRAFT_23689 [Thamnocephalis sphaerospora]|eukprot:RKP08274.1 hypothetical protein THASP1DRAFT_23689 [Thamnocephalis sphaerospora]